MPRAYLTRGTGYIVVSERQTRVDHVRRGIAEFVHHFKYVRNHWRVLSRGSNVIECIFLTFMY